MSPPNVVLARPVRGHHVGRIAGVRAGQWVVDYPENPHGPLPARTTLHPDPAAMQRAADTAAEALLVFDGERSDRPIVVGLLAPPLAPDMPALDMPAPDARGAGRPEVVVDGERLVYTAQHELVLRCGKASIQLLSDGSVRIRGANVLSRASATNRIRGGNVQIN